MTIPPLKRDCLVCQKEFRFYPYRIKDAKFCSRKCYQTTIKIIPNSEKSRFQKGKVYGYEYRFKNNHGMNKDSENPMWKGDKVKYVGLHMWIARKLGQPQNCEHCKTTELRRYEWANKSGKYKRELTDWIRLCVPCHKKYDKRDVVKTNVAIVS